MKLIGNRWQEGCCAVSMAWPEAAAANTARAPTLPLYCRSESAICE